MRMKVQEAFHRVDQARSLALEAPRLPNGVPALTFEAGGPMDRLKDIASVMRPVDEGETFVLQSRNDEDAVRRGIEEGADFRAALPTGLHETVLEGWRQMIQEPRMRVMVGVFEDRRGDDVQLVEVASCCFPISVNGREATHIARFSHSVEAERGSIERLFLDQWIPLEAEAKQALAS